MKKVFAVQASMLLWILYTSCVVFASEMEDKQLTSQLASPTSAFSQKLYQKIAVGKDSIIYSPYSIHSVFTMASDGARGATQSEMRSVLGLGQLGDTARTAYHDLIGQLNDAKKVKVHTANAVFVNPKEETEKTFVDDAAQNYFALAANLDFNGEGGPEKVVNDFVADKTEDMIQDLLSPGSIDPNTVMVLVNTIFFNGTWLHTFDSYLTSKQDFHGANKQVDMMRNEEWFRYKRDMTRKSDILEMPFKGNRFSLSILLPHDNEGIADLENTLTTNGIDDVFQDLKSTYVKVNIPKFKIETKLSLASTLVAMGMKKAFRFGAADFTGINKDGRVYLDDAIHQAVIDVQESGTVAAAATAIMIKTAALFQPEASFIADHPFIFFLRDSQTGLVLFQGKFMG